MAGFCGLAGEFYARNTRHTRRGTVEPAVHAFHFLMMKKSNGTPSPIIRYHFETDKHTPLLFHRNKQVWNSRAQTVGNQSKSSFKILSFEKIFFFLNSVFIQIPFFCFFFFTWEVFLVHKLMNIVYPPPPKKGEKDASKLNNSCFLLKNRGCRFSPECLLSEMTERFQLVFLTIYQGPIKTS